MSKHHRGTWNHSACSLYQYRNVCFLRHISLQKYSGQVQNFVIYMLNNEFSYRKREGLWYANYWTVQEQLVRYYDVNYCELIGNKKPFLTNERQREDDRQKIRDYFKQMLDLGARASEEENPEVSIVLDGIGFVLASDYVEAVNKIFSMLKTTFKNYNYFSEKCFN